MSTYVLPRRALMGAVLAAVVAVVAVAALGSGSARAMPTSMSPPTSASASTSTSSRAVAFHDAMRALWEAHGTWTERAIVDFVGGLPDTNLVVARLLHNQVDIGNAVKPFYGAAAGNRLTALLQAHINAAVGVLKAAKSGNEHSVATAKAAFFANGNRVAAFLHGANPHHWALSDMRTMMRVHLNQVIALAVDQLDGQYAAAIRLYGVYIDHIIDMADMLSTGIIQQFPARF
jgi:hypothetical protein